jgi:hypothetical protein
MLEDLATSGRRITYGDLAKRLGITRQSLPFCLELIRAEEKNAQRPDLTSILHFSNKKYGYVIPKTRTGFRTYREELRAVYGHWGGKPDGDLGAWLKF